VISIYISHHTLTHIYYLFEEGIGFEAGFRAFFRLKSVTKLISTF